MQRGTDCRSAVIHRPRRAFAFGAAIALFAVAIAGCGQSGSDAAKTDAAKAGYAVKADKICARQNEAIHDVGSPAHVREVVAPRLLTEFRELKSLTPPVDVAASAREFLGAMRLVARRAEYNPAYFAKSARPFLRTELLGAHFGFKVCGRL
ncbi:MAG TPA: hypothetical protein VFZ25_20870 [Chloroflexota bacterium]|nr:hypothetical protein [Chloroflexota bacterium]